MIQDDRLHDSFSSGRSYHYNIAVIYHYRGEQAMELGQDQVSKILFDKAADYWLEAIRLAPDNYIEAQNWLKVTGRITF